MGGYALKKKGNPTTAKGSKQRNYPFKH